MASRAVSSDIFVPWSETKTSWGTSSNGSARASQRPQHFDGELWSVDFSRPGALSGGFSVCAGACLNVSLDHDLHGRISLGGGIEAGVSITAGGSSPSESGFFAGGSCTIAGGGIGAYGEAGIQQNGPLGYYGGGVSFGAKAGCSAQPGWGW